MAEKYGKKVKDLMVEEIKETVFENKGFIFSNFSNIKTTAIDTFRKQLRNSGSRYFVIKKSMADLALKEAGVEGFDDIIEEKKSTGVGIIAEDPVEIAKIMTDFAKKNKGFEITSGYLDGRVLTAEKVKELSQLPGREQLLAMVVGTLNAPIAGFVNVLAGTIRSLSNVINAIKDKQE
jgi:large subunit ribosomal protein L10